MTSQIALHKTVMTLGRRQPHHLIFSLHIDSFPPQKVLACRKELVDYDRQQRQAVAQASSPVTSPRDPPDFKPAVKKEPPRSVVT